MKITRQIIVFDAADLAAESTFWAGLLGGTVGLMPGAGIAGVFNATERLDRVSRQRDVATHLHDCIGDSARDLAWHLLDALVRGDPTASTPTSQAWSSGPSGVHTRVK